MALHLTIHINMVPPCGRQEGEAYWLGMATLTGTAGGATLISPKKSAKEASDLMPKDFSNSKSWPMKSRLGDIVERNCLTVLGKM